MVKAILLHCKSYVIAMQLNIKLLQKRYLYSDE